MCDVSGVRSADGDRVLVIRQLFTRKTDDNDRDLPTQESRMYSHFAHERTLSQTFATKLSLHSSANSAAQDCILSVGQCTIHPSGIITPSAVFWSSLGGQPSHAGVTLPRLNPRQIQPCT